MVRAVETPAVETGETTEAATGAETAETTEVAMGAEAAVAMTEAIAAATEPGMVVATVEVEAVATVVVVPILKSGIDGDVGEDGVGDG